MSDFIELCLLIFIVAYIFSLLNKHLDFYEFSKQEKYGKIGFNVVLLPILVNVNNDWRRNHEQKVGYRNWFCNYFAAQC